MIQKYTKYDIYFPMAVYIILVIVKLIFVIDNRTVPNLSDEFIYIICKTIGTKWYVFRGSLSNDVFFGFVSGICFWKTFLHSYESYKCIA